MTKRTDEYAGQSVDQTVRELHTSADSGLGSAEAAARLERYGYNELDERGESLWHRIFRRFWGPIPGMIEIAAILSAMVRQWEDFVVILLMLLVNAALDFFQEHRALNALQALKTRLQNEAIVLRDGEFTTLPVRELVPGDVIKLQIGNVVPADVQLLSGEYLMIDESALTGESLPVTRTAQEAALANTIVKQGEMMAVVVNTGPRTNFHDVVALVARAQREEVSHFQQMVIRIGNFLIAVTVVLVLLILVVALSRHENFLEIARFSLVLTVAAIPVALPAVLSVTMAVGALALARREAIVSRLTAIEELAGVDVFCSDKTGTLTKNEMRVAEPVVLDGHDERELFTVAALASRREDRDPIELPIYAYIDEKFPDLDVESFARTRFVPFDPVRKRTEANVHKNGVSFTAEKGAPQVLIEEAGLSDELSHRVSDAVDEFASKGYRTIAVARGDDGRAELIGLIPLFDPPREDSAAVIEDMHAHGVRVKMITGDNVAIAHEIGGILGLHGKALRAGDLKVGDAGERQQGRGEDNGSGSLQLIEDVNIFAEVVPEDKYRIISVLQRANHIVGMTGDGVNDAPALKKADCGIAVSNATDAARAAADIVLTAPGLGVINQAIKQARITFERMKSYSIFRVAETIRIIVFMTLSIVVFNFYPITALMIIILALLNDIPILAIAYDNTRIQADPVRWDMRELFTVATSLGSAGVASSFLLFFILMRLDFSTEMIQSLFFAKLVIAGHGTIYNTRIKDWFWRRPYPSWLLFGATFSTRIIGTLIAVYGFLIVPIGWKYAGLMWAYALAWFVFNDGVKMVTYRYLRLRDNGSPASGGHRRQVEGQTGS